MRTALLFLSLPLASAAHAFCHSRGWKELGYARLSDQARERLGRSARWVRDLAALSESVESLPDLASALTGEDGGRPIGLVAALHIGKVASRESLAAWISIARTESVRMLKARVGSAATAGSCWPEAEPNSSGSDLPAEGDSLRRVCLRVPAAVREAFAEALDLYRAVEGHNAPAGEFIESLIAEAGSGVLAGKVDLEVSIAGHRRERPEGGSPAKVAFTGIPVQEAIYQARARRWLQKTLGNDHKEWDDRGGRAVWMTGSTREAGSSTADSRSPAVTADARMRRLLSLHDEIERQLAEVVTQLADASAWPALGYVGFDDYARRGLGWSRSTLYNRVQLVRRLRRLPVVREAYQQGRIGRVAAQTIARVLIREAPAGTVPLRIPEATQKAWVERAAVATIKRLQDETRAVARLMVVGRGDREPPDDVTWHASLHRQAGTATRRLQALTSMAMTAPGPMLPLRLTLKRETAADLSRVLAVTSQDPALMQTFSRWQPVMHEVAGAKEPGRGSVETFSTPACSVPVWAALLALLQDFIETWDVDVGGRRPSSQRIYIRDGWRCMAPGCSSRKNLEVHHIVYRSQGGDDRPENLACLCRFHHQMGEHGMLARVRGEAPLGLEWWLGRDGCGGRFRNDLRLNG